MPIAELSIVDEVETAINTGSAEKRLETIKRVTDLFLSSAVKLNGEQIKLFDNVLERLIKTIELRAIADISARIALAEMSGKLAPIAQAPPSVKQRKYEETVAAHAELSRSTIEVIRKRDGYRSAPRNLRDTTPSVRGMGRRKTFSAWPCRASRNVCGRCAGEAGRNDTATPRRRCRTAPARRR